MNFLMKFFNLKKIKLFLNIHNKDAKTNYRKPLRVV